jgi:hypothetical protein
MQTTASQLQRQHPQNPHCGWFDSSLELRQGLDVHELSDLELLALWTELRPAPAASLH